MVNEFYTKDANIFKPDIRQNAILKSTNRSGERLFGILKRLLSKNPMTKDILLESCMKIERFNGNTEFHYNLQNYLNKQKKINCKTIGRKSINERSTISQIKLESGQHKENLANKILETQKRKEKKEQLMIKVAQYFPGEDKISKEVMNQYIKNNKKDYPLLRCGKNMIQCAEIIIDFEADKSKFWKEKM